MTKPEMQEPLTDRSQLLPIHLAERGQRIVATKPSRSQANEILLRIALIGWRNAAAYSNTLHIQRCGQPLDFLDLESDL